MNSPGPLSEASVPGSDRHGPLSSVFMPPCPWRDDSHQDPHDIVHLLRERTSLGEMTQARLLLSQHLVNKPLETEIQWGRRFSVGVLVEVGDRMGDRWKEPSVESHALPGGASVSLLVSLLTSAHGVKD